jgi:hypothetical protein
MKRAREPDLVQPASSCPIELVQDNYPVIMYWALRMPWEDKRERSNMVANLSLVCKDWCARVHTIVDDTFRALCTKAHEVDAMCRMRYPMMLLDLQDEMRAFCAALHMWPWQVMVYVEPSWATERVTAADVAAVEAFMVAQATEYRARYFYLYEGHMQCGDYWTWERQYGDHFHRLLDGEGQRHNASEVYRVLTENPNWPVHLQRVFFGRWFHIWDNTYLLALFLNCVLGDAAFDMCAKHAVARLDTLWDLHLIKDDSDALRNYYAPSDGSEPSRFSSIGRHRYMYLTCPSVHHWANRTGNICANKLLDIPDPQPVTATWRELFPNLTTMPKSHAQSVYHYLRNKTHRLWTEELRATFEKILM